MLACFEGFIFCNERLDSMVVFPGPAMAPALFAAVRQQYCLFRYVVGFLKGSHNFIKGAELVATCPNP